MCEIKKQQHGKTDLVWVVLLASVGAVLCAFISETVFDASIFFSGILCVSLIAIGRREGYLVGLYNSVSYAVLAYSNGLFGEVYLNVFFFLPTGILGFIMWSRHTSDHVVRMQSLSWRARVLVAGSCILCTVALGWVLGLNPRQNTPYVDASTNVLSVIATFLMMWRYKEQWLLYITLNVVSVIMWVLRFRAGGNAGDLMILMWSLFLLNAIFGYWRWHVGAAASATPATDTGNVPEEPLCAAD